MGDLSLEAGLCETADDLDVGLWFTFDNYASYYYWELDDEKEYRHALKYVTLLLVN